MMSMIYLLTEGAKAQLNAGRIVVTKQKETLWSIPLRDVESLVIGRTAQITTQAVYAIIREGGFIFYVDRNGKIYGALGDEKISLQRLRNQMQYFENEQIQLALSKYVVEKKIRNQKNLLLSYKKHNATLELYNAVKAIGNMISKVRNAETTESLLGIEGNAAREYFGVFGTLVSANGFSWSGRHKHPAPDPVNALLSYGYFFLEREVRIALAAFGADVRIGFFHTNNGRKDSLVYDLMELFRASVSDRLVLKLLNLGRIKPDDFVQIDNQSFLSAEGKKKWCQYYEEYMQTGVKEYGGISPRDLIRNQIQVFFREEIEKIA
mgnify:CR=1 FL=1